MSGSSMSRSVADPGKRFVAFLIDVAPIVALQIFGSLVSSGAIGGLVALAVLAYSIYNQLYLQGTTGQSIGKKQQGITLLRADNGQPVGIAMAFVRSLLSGVIALVCLLDHWIILVDKDKRRISDKILGFHVYNA